MKWPKCCRKLVMSPLCSLEMSPLDFRVRPFRGCVEAGIEGDGDGEGSGSSGGGHGGGGEAAEAARGGGAPGFEREAGEAAGEAVPGAGRGGDGVGAARVGRVDDGALPHASKPNTAANATIAACLGACAMKTATLLAAPSGRGLVACLHPPWIWSCFICRWSHRRTLAHHFTSAFEAS